jgi:hypothetical protein
VRLVLLCLYGGVLVVVRLSVVLAERCVPAPASVFFVPRPLEPPLHLDVTVTSDSKRSCVPARAFAV